MTCDFTRSDCKIQIFIAVLTQEKYYLIMLFCQILTMVKRFLITFANQRQTGSSFVPAGSQKRTKWKLSFVLFVYSKYLIVR